MSLWQLNYLPNDVRSSTVSVISYRYVISAVSTKSRHIYCSKPRSPLYTCHVSRHHAIRTLKDVRSTTLYSASVKMHGSKLRLEVNANAWQRGHSCCHPLTRCAWDIDKQRLRQYSQVLCVLNSITQSITIPVILQEKNIYIFFSSR